MTLAASNEIFWKFDEIVIFEICSSLLQSLSKLTPVFKRIFSTSFSIFPIYFLKIRSAIILNGLKFLSAIFRRLFLNNLLLGKKSLKIKHTKLDFLSGLQKYLFYKHFNSEVLGKLIKYVKIDSRIF